MQKHTQHIDTVKKIIAKTIRTNNTIEQDPNQMQIGSTVQHYFQNQFMELIPNRSTPGTTYCGYTEYETDHTGEYTYFIGELVDEVTTIPEGFSVIEIPNQTYAKMTVGPGQMPKILIDAWVQIWKMTDHDFGGRRSYAVDFEVYDERARDPSSAELDIYIGIA